MTTVAFGVVNEGQKVACIDGITVLFPGAEPPIRIGQGEATVLSKVAAEVPENTSTVPVSIYAAVEGVLSPPLLKIPPHPFTGLVLPPPLQPLVPVPLGAGLSFVADASGGVIPKNLMRFALHWLSKKPSAFQITGPNGCPANGGQVRRAMGTRNVPSPGVGHTSAAAQPIPKKGFIGKLLVRVSMNTMVGGFIPVRVLVNGVEKLLVKVPAGFTGTIPVNPSTVAVAKGDLQEFEIDASVDPNPVHVIRATASTEFSDP